MKFCKDCKYFKKTNILPICLKSAVHSEPNMVSGKSFVTHFRCHQWRRDYYIHVDILAHDHCGSEAKYFEPKPQSRLSRAVIWLKESMCK